MRRCRVALFAVLVAFALPAAAPAPSILGVPVLIVFPFSANGGDITKEAGSELAVTIATQIANLGSVSVKPAPPGVERANFLEAAQHAGADYYIAGYMTPLGDGVSVVEQLVSTQAGIVVYSNSAQVRTFADATGQGDILREALLRHQSRNLGAYTAPPPPAVSVTPTPAPGSATQANLGHLFGRGRKGRSVKTAATPAASTAPATQVAAAGLPSAAPKPLASAAVASGASGVPSAAAASAATHGNGYGLLALGGSAADERRSFAVAALRNDMLAKHQPVSEAVVTRETACRTDDVGTLVGGNLSTSKHTILGQPQTTATLEFVAYDCAGNVVYHQTFAHGARGDWKDAVDGVVATAVAAFLHGPATRRS